MAENPTVSTGLAPQTVVLRFQQDPQATATNTTVGNAGIAPFACTLTGAVYVPSAGVTHSASNYRTWAVVDKASGDTMASLASNTADFASDVAESFTLSGTATNLNIAAGDVIEVNSSVTGTGVADPGGVIEVTLSKA